jgi:hypothetical protein
MMYGDFDGSFVWFEDDPNIFIEEIVKNVSHSD